MERPLTRRIHFGFHVDRGAGRYADHVLDRVPFLGRYRGSTTCHADASDGSSWSH